MTTHATQLANPVHNEVSVTTVRVRLESTDMFGDRCVSLYEHNRKDVGEHDL